MEQQKKTNQLLMREIEDMKKSKKSVEDMTPLVPRVLDFTTPGFSASQHVGSLTASYAGHSAPYHQWRPSTIPLSESSAPLFQGSSALHQLGSSAFSQLGSSTFQQAGSSSHHQPGSSEVHEGDIIPMQTVASSGPTIPQGFSNPGFTFGIPSQNQEEGNTYNNVSLNTNHGFVQDTGISPFMAKELQKLRDMISSVPGVIKPIAEVPPGSHRISRFAPPIYDTEIPKRF